MNELSPRASDTDRERTVVELREHLVQGRLTLDEFSERVELAYRARSLGDLQAVGSALPTVQTGPIRRRPIRATIGLFAHVVRRGRLRLGRWLAVLAGFSDVDLDLRGAEITGLETSLHVLLAFGNVKQTIPVPLGQAKASLGPGCDRLDF